jgi:hypothetical protein
MPTWMNDVALSNDKGAAETVMLVNFFKRCFGHVYWHLTNWRLSLYLMRLVAGNVFSRTPLVQNSGPTVSMTTYGARIDSVFLALETIGRGAIRPGRLVLWIDDPVRFSKLPVSLRRLQKRGLEIELCENFGPHTKYYPYVEAHNDFTEPLVTADDDVLYPTNWLSGLIDAYENDDQVISCYCARTLRVDGQRLAPYVTWPLCSSTQPSLRNFVTGVSGVIYPPPFLAHLKAAGREFVDVCPKADDVWLHVNAVRLRYRVRQIKDVALTFQVVPGTQELALYQSNMFGGGNDEQISKTYRASDIAALANES